MPLYNGTRNKPSVAERLPPSLSITVGDEDRQRTYAGPNYARSVMPVIGVGEYHLGTSASWDEYLERLEIYCEANKLSKEKKSVRFYSAPVEKKRTVPS